MRTIAGSWIVVVALLFASSLPVALLLPFTLQILAQPASVGTRTSVGTWTIKAPRLTPRSAMGYALYKGMIVVTGGEMRARTFDENEAFDLKAQRWLTLAPMPSRRLGHGAASGALQPGGTGNTDQLIMFNQP